MAKNAILVRRGTARPGAWLRLLGAALLTLPACDDNPSGPSTGSLTVAVSGLPGGTAASVEVTGPGGFSRTVSGTETFGPLVPGRYTVAASAVTTAPASDASTYAPSPQHQSIDVTPASSPDTAAVTYYLVVADAFNLAIDGMYLTQSVQTYAGGVPLVRGRDGYLRVFVVANRANTAQPAVRVRLYLGGATPAASYTIPAPGPAVPTGVDESSLSSSWNVRIPGALIQPDLSILADVDPDGAVAEGNEADNAFPSSSVPRPMDVRTAPAFLVRFVPVRQSVNGYQGNVTLANREQFLAFSRKMHPVSSYDSDVRAVYTTSAPAVTSDNGNESWNKVLQEVNALRAADRDGSRRHYYGVVRTTYTNGIAGIGYVGGRSAIGWDFLPSGGAVAAHEWGHNWGRNHAPCGNPSDVDTRYPYDGGAIGVYGLDVAAGLLKSPSSTDLMGYCRSQWISDYTYVGVLNYRATTTGVASAGAGAGGDAGADAGAAPGGGASTDAGTGTSAGANAGVGTNAGVVQPALLVWGRIVNGEPVLEPAFQVTTRPLLPERPGPYAVEGRAADGSVVFAISFAAEAVADVPGGGEHFAFAVPLPASQAARVSALRLSARGRVATVTAAVPPAARFRIGRVADSVAVRRAAAGRVALRWDTLAHPMVMVRDPATGQVLSFARGGDASVWTDRDDLELVLSDRVRSVAKRVRVVPR